MIGTSAIKRLLSKPPDFRVDKKMSHGGENKVLRFLQVNETLVMAHGGVDLQVLRALCAIKNMNDLCRCVLVDYRP